MPMSSQFANRAWLVTLVALAAVPFGCGGPSEISADKAAAIPVYNPSPDNKLKDVNLQNEYQFKDKIGGMSNPK
jgi:hypothetical protein